MSSVYVYFRIILQMINCQKSAKEIVFL